jgi:hypothetical protein
METEAYQVLCLLLLGQILLLLQHLLLPEGRAENAFMAEEPRSSARRLHGTLEWRHWCWWREVLSVGFLHLDALDVAEADV